jgi:hypothetical protein
MRPNQEIGFFRRKRLIAKPFAYANGAVAYATLSGVTCHFSAGA